MGLGVVATSVVGEDAFFPELLKLKLLMSWHKYAETHFLDLLIQMNVVF